jgi:hypothetical protein
VILCSICGDKLTAQQVRYVRSPEGKRPVCQDHERLVAEIHAGRTDAEKAQWENSVRGIR